MAEQYDLVITHTDRDGLFSAAALLRALGAPDGPHVLLTQGSYLAEELEDLAATAKTWDRIFVCDTYWHAPAASRLVAALHRIRAPGGTLTWIDHHPATVEHEAWMRQTIGLDAQSLVLGDRAGKHEAVSLVARAFGSTQDPVVSDLLKATASHWLRTGEPEPSNVTCWLRIVDALPRFPELAAEAAAQIVRHLARGFDTAPPPALWPLEAMSAEVERQTSRLADPQRWSRLPSVDGGHGLLLDLSAEPLANTYVVARTLFDSSDRRVDYFVTAEHPGLVHYVSGEQARRERDRLELNRPAGLKVSTMHKGGRWLRSASWRAQNGIDLSYLTRRRPGRDIERWIDAHPYLVKGMWREGVLVDAARIQATASEVGAAMLEVLQRLGWQDGDRCAAARRQG